MPNNKLNAISVLRKIEQGASNRSLVQRTLDAISDGATLDNGQLALVKTFVSSYMNSESMQTSRDAVLLATFINTAQQKK